MNFFTKCFIFIQNNYIKKDMKLLKTEHPINGIWYFTSAVKAAIWLDTTASNIYTSMKNRKTVKRTTFEWVDSDGILPQYINPTKTGNDTIELLEKAIKMLEENEKDIRLLKEIVSNINDKIEKKKIIIK